MNFKQDSYGWIDAHNHPRIFGEKDHALNQEWIDNLLRASEMLNIEKMCISSPHTSDQFVKPETVKECNDATFDCMNYSDKFWGFCFINPGWAKEACEEIKRCFDLGMIGIKLYHHYFMNDPAQTAVCELAGKLGLPILMHSGKLNGECAIAQPRTSDASHMIEAAKRFPQTTFIQGHIGGGGDWEWNIRTLEVSPQNLYVDISGSVHDAEIIRKLVDAIGAERVLFATDMSFEASVGKLLDANVTATERKLIARDNFLKIMKGLNR